MAYYESHTFTTGVQMFQDLAAFVAANGWTIDYNGTQGSYWRVHFHKGAAHFDVYGTQSLGGSIYGCTGYTPGTTGALQPNATPAKGFAGLANGTYHFISTKGAIYVALPSVATLSLWNSWLCFFEIQDKVGVWAGGHGCGGGAGGSLFGGSWCTAPENGQIWYEGEWTANTIALFGVIGNGRLNTMANTALNHYNGGIVPFPVLIMRCAPVDSSKRVPLGYAPGLYQTHGGDVYDIGDEIIIGTDTYKIFPCYSNYMGSTFGEYLFKLGS